MIRSNRNCRLTLCAGALAVAAIAPAAAQDRIALQPRRPVLKADSLKKPVPPKPPADLDPTAPGAKIDAMDAPKLYLKPSNVGAVPPFRDSHLGAHPNLGGADAGSPGYPHYDHQRYRYDIWYRPHAFGYGARERCAPQPWRPRGYGDLFAEPSTCLRMDYSRYELKNYGTDYGPSYYRRQASEYCKPYNHPEWHRPQCDPSRLRPADECGPGGTQVWTIRGHRQD